MAALLYLTIWLSYISDEGSLQEEMLLLTWERKEEDKVTFASLLVEN